MATNIVVMGLPGDLKFTKLLNKFRAYFRRLNIKMFWIREAIETEGGQQVTVELVNMADAKKAQNFLNNQPFVHEMSEYPMDVHVENTGGHFRNRNEERTRNEDYERRPRPAKRNRPRSRSPGYRQEASKLDMEIELLRKQRQVIEEERRLLVEQKKLEMIREYGPSAAREFDHFDDFEPPRKKRQPEPVSKRPRQRSPQFAKIPKTARPKGLPVFFQPCKRLIGQLKPHIEKGTTPEEAAILIKLIRAAMRKELAITLEGKAFMPTLDIVKLYRESHPVEEDEAFVGKILTKIRASCLTTEIKVEKDEAILKNIKKEVSEIETDGKGNEKETDITKATENDTNDTKDNENDAKANDNGAEVANNETAIKDSGIGENETDAAVPAVALTTEPNTSQDLENTSAGNLSEEKVKTNNMSQDLENTSAGNLSEEKVKTNNMSKDLENTSAGNLSEEKVKTNNMSQDLENTSAGNLSEEKVKTNNMSPDLENTSAGKVSEVKMKNNDDALGLDESEDALLDGPEKDEDWVEDWNAEEEKV